MQHQFIGKDYTIPTNCDVKHVTTLELHRSIRNCTLQQGDTSRGTYGLGDALGVPLHGVLAEELAAIDAR